jgi:hypothetical protein
MTTVLSSSKMASVMSLVKERLNGGVGVRLPLLCAGLLRALREKIAPANVRTFLFLMLALRSGDVFGLVGVLVVCRADANSENEVIGSFSSTEGVCLGVVLGDTSALPPDVNQNFRLFAGLPELEKKPVESDAERGLFGRPPAPHESSVRMDICELGLAASAVFGLGAGLLASTLGEGLNRVAGLPNDVMLPVRE